MLQQLMHPAIVELRNIATDGDGTCLVLEYVDSDLEGLLGRLVARSWRLPSCGARHFCAQMLVGLQHLHDHGAVSYTHLRAHETPEHLVCRLLLEKKKKKQIKKKHTKRI
eukprot:TRINITY_DN9905_c0_g1_i5.p2 TRINITY_DN9905_c0_g1~~TRINITY_DN9905_c0_g1_i5.p2  ORF type:complete len:110 (-),score=28.42 TRINITY_DN9905_c0_g1_i5:70-399(-)